MTRSSRYQRHAHKQQSSNTYHWHWHSNDQYIGDDISRREHGQHVQCVRTLREEDCDRCPIETPVQAALENCCKKEGGAPCNRDTDHNPAYDVEGMNMTKYPAPQE